MIKSTKNMQSVSEGDGAWI